MPPPDDKLRVLHVINSLGVGGAETMLLKLTSRSQGERFTHEVVSLDYEGPLVPRYQEAGIDVRSLGLTLSRPRFAPLRALCARIRESDPMMIHGWMYYGNIAALLGRWLTGSHAALAWNIRQTVYDLGTQKRTTAASIRAGAWFSGRPNAIVYNSLTSANQHERLGYDPTKRRLIPNGFDCNVFSPDPRIRVRLRKSLGFQECDIVVTLVARYHPMKDHSTFVAAAAKVGRLCPNVRFLIVGRGVTSPDAGILAAVESSGIAGRTVALELREDVAAIYNASDIAISSSAWGEGFSNAIGEAMACGVPCVVTDIGDSAAIVAETGIVVAPRDPAALAAAIGELVAAGPERRRALGEAARRRVEEHFSLSAVVAQYEALYESLAQTQRPGEARTRT